MNSEWFDTTKIKRDPIGANLLKKNDYLYSSGEKGAGIADCFLDILHVFALGATGEGDS